MKIAMIMSNPFPPREGIGFYVYNLSKKLIENGHTVSVITRGNHLFLEDYMFEEINIIKPKYFPIYPFHVQIHKRYIEKTIENLSIDFDLFHIHSPLAPVVCNKGIPIVSTIHTSLLEDIKHYQISNLKTFSSKLLTHFSSKFFIQELMNKSKITTTVSTGVANELKKYYNVRKIVVAGNGVDEKKFFPINKKDNNYMLYVGRLDYRKGVLDLIEASKLLNTEIKIIIVGEGPLKQLIEEKIRNNEINNIVLKGHLSGQELVEIYQNALIFIFPSHYEGLPTVLLEAMASGLPVVTTDIPAHKDLIKNMHNGLFFRKGSPKDMSDKIRILLENDKLRTKISENARHTIERKFTWDIVCKKFEDIYKDSLSW